MKRREEKRNMLGDLPQGRHNLRLIFENSPKQPLVYMEGVNEDKHDSGS
jgi:hypothetical protein